MSKEKRHVESSGQRLDLDCLKRLGLSDLTARKILNLISEQPPIEAFRALTLAVEQDAQLKDAIFPQDSAREQGFFGNINAGEFYRHHIPKAEKAQAIEQYHLEFERRIPLEPVCFPALYKRPQELLYIPSRLKGTFAVFNKNDYALTIMQTVPARLAEICHYKRVKDKVNYWQLESSFNEPCPERQLLAKLAEVDDGHLLYPMVNAMHNNIVYPLAVKPRTETLVGASNDHGSLAASKDRVLRDPKIPSLTYQSGCATDLIPWLVENQWFLPKSLEELIDLAAFLSPSLRDKINRFEERHMVSCVNMLRDTGKIEQDQSSVILSGDECRIQTGAIRGKAQTIVLKLKEGRWEIDFDRSNHPDLGRHYQPEPEYQSSDFGPESVDQVIWKENQHFYGKRGGVSSALLIDLLKVLWDQPTYQLPFDALNSLDFSTDQSDFFKEQGFELQHAGDQTFGLKRFRVLNLPQFVELRFTWDVRKQSVIDLRFKIDATLIQRALADVYQEAMSLELVEKEMGVEAEVERTEVTTASVENEAASSNDGGIYEEDDVQDQGGVTEQKPPSEQSKPESPSDTSPNDLHEFTAWLLQVQGVEVHSLDIYQCLEQNPDSLALIGLIGLKNPTLLQNLARNPGRPVNRLEQLSAYINLDAQRELKKLSDSFAQQILVAPSLSISSQEQAEDIALNYLSLICKFSQLYFTQGLMDLWLTHFNQAHDRIAVIRDLMELAPQTDSLLGAAAAKLSGRSRLGFSWLELDHDTAEPNLKSLKQILLDQIKSNLSQKESSQVVTGIELILSRIDQQYLRGYQLSGQSSLQEAIPENISWASPADLQMAKLIFIIFDRLSYSDPHVLVNVQSPLKREIEELVYRLEALEEVGINFHQELWHGQRQQPGLRKVVGLDFGLENFALTEIQKIVPQLREILNETTLPELDQDENSSYLNYVQKLESIWKEMGPSALTYNRDRPMELANIIQLIDAKANFQLYAQANDEQIIGFLDRIRQILNHIQEDRENAEEDEFHPIEKIEVINSLEQAEKHLTWLYHEYTVGEGVIDDYRRTSKTLYLWVNVDQMGLEEAGWKNEFMTMVKYAPNIFFFDHHISLSGLEYTIVPWLLGAGNAGEKFQLVSQDGDTVAVPSA
jgi:hypothetical protein